LYLEPGIEATACARELLYVYVYVFKIVKGFDNTNMVYLCTPLIYTKIYLHCFCDYLASTPPNRNCASQKLAIKWPPVALSTTQITLSCYGLDQKKQSFSDKAILSVLLLGLDLITSHNHVWLLGAMISCDLSLDRHVSNISSSRLWHVQRSLDMDSATTLVHSSVLSCVSYCNTLLAGAPRAVTSRLQQVLNAAAFVVFSTHKYNEGLWLLQSELPLAHFAWTSCVQTWHHDILLCAQPSAWWTSVYQSLMSHQDSIFDLLLDDFWLFHDAGSAQSAHMPSRWPGLHVSLKFIDLQIVRSSS